MVKDSKQSEGAGYKPVTQNINFPELEEAILKYWKENKIFEKSVSSRPENNRWTILDGPPFITGKPHYGTLLSSLPKDVFPRFKTMQGYRVRRVWGWDCHGLPAENKVENKLGLKSKREIEEKVGVKKFIDECKLYVSEVSGEWEWYVDHIGRWVDFKNAYRTMDLPYMESVMWVFKQMYEKGYIYKGLRVSLYCPHCATPISNFEVAMDAENYKEIHEPSTTYRYQIAGEDKTYILAWSTTPWNKIATPALAVNPKLQYVKVKQGDEYLILAKTSLRTLKTIRHAELVSASSNNGNEILKQVQDDTAKEGVDYEIVAEFSGKELIGKKFIPHYDYYKAAPGEKIFEIIGGDFVTADEGTGVVTIAAYGEEDLVVMKRDNVHIELHVDEEGTIKPDVPLFGGMYYLKANKYVEEDLDKRGLIYKHEDYSHRVPLCWRCHTRLYYAPQDAWFVDIQKLKPLLKKTNEKINWFPKHFKYGRFLKSLENAPDWNISRSRYWGSPVPVWECTCGERFVPGSIKELEEASGQKIIDLHKPEIDAVRVNCKKCGEKAVRVSEVLDSWIEAGSASFAERNYPFAFMREHGILRFAQDDPVLKKELDRFFPPDFIAEYTGQIRAWFYVLHVIGAALYESIAFKNVIVEGVILGTDGRKMSKNFGNYPDPKEMLQKYGGDALRLYLLGSPVMHGEDIIISEEQYRNQIKGPMLLLWNVYNFFVTYANIDKWEGTNGKWQMANGKWKTPIESGKISNVLDRWILSLLHRLTKEITESLEGFDTVKAVELVQLFIEDLSKWYIRRSRERVGPSAPIESRFNRENSGSAENNQDKNEFYAVCYEVLTTLCKLIAPFAPFISEEIYRNLSGEESVHLSKWPEFDPTCIDEPLEQHMKNGRELASIILMKRKINNIKVRIPLKTIAYKGPTELRKEVLKVVEEEANILELNYKGNSAVYETDPDSAYLDLKNQDLLAGQARDLVRLIQEERKKLGLKVDELVTITLPDWPAEFEEYIKRNALIGNLKKGERLEVKK